ncbi:hypothetical protein FACS189490_08040 [Clostridia bacterium]|nr:hypothetical protein FACS189490_08040 [Clostridia bacterium]
MENGMDLYCALLHCATWIEDLKHGRPVEFLTPCYFCKYTSECKCSFYGWHLRR